MAGLHCTRKPLQETPVPVTVMTFATQRLSNMSMPHKASSCRPISLPLDSDIEHVCKLDGHITQSGHYNSTNLASVNSDSGDNDISKESGLNGKYVKVDPGLNLGRRCKETSQSFVVSFGDDNAAKKEKEKKGHGRSLQDAFETFRMIRQNEIRQSQMMKERELAARCDHKKMWQLRMKFVETAKNYFGVPYAKKYHQPGTPEYYAPLFLDCCALVRQVLRDLKEDFGFNIGPWNQAYQYDTLPITIEEETEMKPGDLVFISGVYYNKKSKKQRHNMVHVEIWAGEGAKTIGARWQKGKVQVFDSYKFDAKSYHSMQYYFKSIDTWLQGICKSYCPEHAWTATTYEPGRKSIFSVQQQQECNEDEGAGDTEDDLIESDAEESVRTVDSRLQGKSDEEDDKDKMDAQVVNLQQVERGEPRHKRVRNSSQSRKGKDGDNGCCEYSEKSSVHATPRVENDSAEIEERCSKSIECISKQSLSGKESDVGSGVNSKNRSTGQEKGAKVSKGRGESRNLENPTLVSENTNFVQDTLKALTLQRQHNSNNACDYETIHRDQIHNECQLDVATTHCWWSNHCSGDETRVSLEKVNYLSSGPEVDELPGERNSCKEVIAHSAHSAVINVAPDRSGCQGTRLDAPPKDIENNRIHDIVCGRLQPNEGEADLNARQGSRLDRKEGTMNMCCCCPDAWYSEKNTEEFDTTSLDDWPWPEVTENIEDNGMWKTRAGKTSEALDCDTAQCYNDSSNCCGFNSIQSYHGNGFQPTKQVGNLCSLDQISCSRKGSDLNSGYHGDDVTNIEATDGDDDKSHNGASKGSTNGQAGRKSPDKKGQKSQPSKGKNPGEPHQPSGTGGAGGGGSISRPFPTKTLGPAFYIGGANGVSLVEDPLLARGWHRIHDRHSDSFKLKWVELKTHISYNSFRPGDQLVNRIPNTHLLATKTGLFTTLRDYERLMERTSKTKSSKVLKLCDFFAESFILDLKADREAFFQTFKEGDIWISKPNGMNQGKGIYLVRDITELRRKYEEQENGTRKARPMLRGSRLIQRYIPNPLLLEGKKFDVRTYMLIACTNPYLVLFHTGYLRLACDNYDADSMDLHRHLTNQYQQKKHPSYQEVKEETVWSMERFNDHVSKIAKEKGLAKDWVMGYFHKQMSKIMLHCFNAVKNKLDCKLGYFDLLGFDFLIDTDMKVWLIEINVNPALHTNCEVLRNLLPGMIEETLDIVLEVFEKSKRNRPIMPLISQRKFKVLHNDSSSSGSNENLRPAKSTSPPRCSPTRPVRARSTSPPKRKHTSARPVPVRQNVTKVSVKTSIEKVVRTPQENSKDAS